jgi:hypothetical protein
MLERLPQLVMGRTTVVENPILHDKSRGYEKVAGIFIRVRNRGIGAFFRERFPRARTMLAVEDSEFFGRTFDGVIALASFMSRTKSK